MLLGNIALILVGTFGVLHMLSAQLKKKQGVVAMAYQVISEEAISKKSILSDLADIAMGLIEPDEVAKAKHALSDAEDKLVEEHGRIALAEAELHAIEKRLREIEELERELEMSTIDAQRELELLKDQERLMREETEKLRQTLSSSKQTLDQLLEELSSSQLAVEKLTAAKVELINTETKLDYYTEEISRLNGLYMELKKGYDALDIEYAQLYERQNSVI